MPGRSFNPAAPRRHWPRRRSGRASRTPAKPRTLLGGRFEARNASLRELIEFAYEIQQFQLVASLGPLEAARWDVAARLEGLPPPAASGEVDDTLLSLRALLAERFGLVVLGASVESCPSSP
jgi:uncharacterized protein (TIGR03435 family)